MSANKKVIFVLVSLILFYSIFVLISDLEKVNEHFLSMNISYIFIIIPTLLFTIFLRSIIQKIILNNLGINISLKENFQLFLAGLSMVVSPGGTGQVIKSHFLQKKHGYPISQSISLVFVERFYDLMTISFVVFLTLFFFMRLESIIAVLISSSLMITIFIILKNHFLFEKFLALASKINFLKRIIPQDKKTIDSIEKLFSKKIMIQILPLIFSIFLIEGIIVYMGFLAFNLEIDYIKSIQLFYTSIIFGVLSFIPGGLGITDGTLAVFLSNEINSFPLATATVIFVRLTTIWSSVLIGVITTLLIFRK